MIAYCSLFHQKNLEAKLAKKKKKPQAARRGYRSLCFMSALSRTRIMAPLGQREKGG